MKNRTNGMLKTLIIMISVFLLSALTVFAATDVEREYTFTTTDKDFRYTKNQTINIDGKEYKAKDTDYELIKTDKRIKVTKEYKNLATKEVPKEIDGDGQKLKLADVKYTDVNYTKTTVYDGYINKPDIPLSKDIKAGDTIITGKLTDTKSKVSATYDTPFAVTGAFVGDSDVTYYVIAGAHIPASTVPPFIGYEAEVLKYLRLDPGMYRIDSGSWTGGYYDKDGKTMRDASFAGMQKSHTYTATYSGTAYNAAATYVNDFVADTYTVKAKVSYAPKLNLAKVIAIGVGILILAAASAYILYLIKRKKGESKYYQTK